MSLTHFPYNIYTGEKVQPLPYHRRDLVYPEHMHFEQSQQKDIPHSKKEPIRWNWGQYANGYGYGNAMGHLNCPCNCENKRKDYVSEKTLKSIEHLRNTQYS